MGKICVGCGKEIKSPTWNQTYCSGVCKDAYLSSMAGRHMVFAIAAKRRGLECSLTVEEFRELKSSPCYLCGEHGDVGIDRVVSSIGYIKGNVEACCSVCNSMKFVFELEAFINQCKKIVNHNSKQVGIGNFKKK